MVNVFPLYPYIKAATLDGRPVTLTKRAAWPQSDFHGFTHYDVAGGTFWIDEASVHRTNGRTHGTGWSNDTADEYVIKSFAAEVLSARVQALLRRTYDYSG